MMDGAFSEIHHSSNGKYDLATNMEDIFGTLNQQANSLFAMEEDIQKLIANSQVTMTVTRECATWLENVKKIKQDLDDIKDRYEAAREQGETFVNLPSRVKLAQEMLNNSEAIVALKDQMKPDTILLKVKSLPMVEKIFHDTVEKMLGYLKDQSIRSIGVWGMAGVGKTTIMKIVKDEAEKQGMFDIVAFVKVSKEGNIGKIQKAIAERMKLNVDGINCDYHLACLIRKTLEKRKYLLLLDEVFSEIDLHAVGIPDSHEHGKVVVATRFRSLCNLMHLDEEIKVKRMCRGDAWRLFRKIVGEAADHPIIRPIAERIVKECGELPQLIKVIAGMLRNKFDEDVWLRILSRLQSPADRRLQPLQEVLGIFRLVYDELDDNLKQCLLYGASFPEDHEICINYLIECWMAEELLPDAHMITKARQKGQILVENLIGKHLLERCKEPDYVKMPIILRQVALRITDVDNNWLLLVRDGENQLRYPPLEQWGRARVISLMGSELRRLPARPESCLVSTLFLQQSVMLTQIPPLFFDFMASLKVLDLSGTGIRSLPESISNLTNLRGLYLSECRHLSVLPKQIADLKNLEVLEIRQTGLCCLPTYIGELTHLQCLKVSFMSCRCCKDNTESLNVDMIPPNIIKQLSLLQELTIDVDPLDTRWNEVAPTIAKDVATLTMLNSLSYYFPSLDCFEEFIRSSVSWNNSLLPFLHDKFMSFRFTVGPQEINRPGKFAKRHLRFFRGKDVSSIVNNVLKRACVFEMVGHESVRNLSDFGTDVIEGLEICVIEGCDKLEKIVGHDAPTADVLPWLKELRLVKLDQFHCIWEGPIMPNSFAKLTTVTLSDCPKVKKLLSVEMTGHLEELQYLRIEKCSQITEIIAADKADMLGTFPSLKTLELVDLPNLVRICGENLLEWPSLQRVEIIACDALAVLPFNGRNSMQLQTIMCSEGWWGTLMLHQEVKDHLQRVSFFV